MTLEELIKHRIERIQSVPDALLSNIDKNNEVLFKELLKQLDKLEVVDGKIVASTKNLAAVNDIVNRLQKVLFGSDYVDAIKTFATEISVQATVNDKILTKVVGSFEDKAIYKATVKAAQKNALLLMDENAVASNVMKPLTDLLTNSTVTSSSFTDMVESMRKSMVGENAQFSKYAGTVVKDAFAIADAQYVQLTAKDNGIEFYRWDGGHVEDTRKFCNERYGQVFHEKEIAAWGSNINTDKAKFERPAASPVYKTKTGVKLYWEGENYDTNSATIFSYRGGYGCMHVLVPQPTKYVEQSIKDRAQAKGYYAP